MSLMKSILTAKDGISNSRRGMIQLANFIFGRLLSKAISHLSKEKGPFFIRHDQFLSTMSKYVSKDILEAVYSIFT